MKEFNIIQFYTIKFHFIPIYHLFKIKDKLRFANSYLMKLMKKIIFVLQ